MSVPAIWASSSRGGGPFDGSLERLDGEVLHGICEQAFAPGAPVELRVTLAEERVAFHARTVGSKRRDDGRFDVRLRPIDLRRGIRDALRDALRAAVQ